MLAIKLVLAWQLPLFGDEAFYWLESRHPAPAHDDVPAATPLLIRLGTAVAGDTPIGVRWPFLLLALGSIGLLATAAKRMCGAAAAAWVVLLGLALPLWAADGLLALPDVPLNFAIVLCLVAVQRLLRAVDPAALALLALGLALGWWSHYRFVMPLAAAGIALGCLPAGRVLLREPKVWIAGGLGNLLGLAPLLWHQFVARGGGFAFQFVERHPWQFQPERLLEPLQQALVVTPLLYLALLWALWRGLRAADARLRWWAGFALALLLLYWLVGAFADSERSRAHWPVPAYAALLPVVAAQMAALGARGRRNLSVAAGLGATAVLAGAGYLAIVAQAPARLASDEQAYPHNFAGWREAAAAVRDALAASPPETVVVADHFTLAAQLQFLLGPEVRVYSLDHPINRKHGRQGELARMQRDEAALDRLPRSLPRLVVIEESATRLRQRPAWYAGICARYPNADRLFDRPVHHGRKRLIAYRAAPDATACVPPAIGYFVAPGWDAPAAPGMPIEGWALRGGVGIAALRLRIDDTVTVEPEHHLPLPSLAQYLPVSDDPNAPRFGFRARWPAGVHPGPHWLILEGRSAGGDWVQLASVHVR